MSRVFCSNTGSTSVSVISLFLHKAIEIHINSESGSRVGGSQTVHPPPIKLSVSRDHSSNLNGKPSSRTVYTERFYISVWRKTTENSLGTELSWRWDIVFDMNVLFRPWDLREEDNLGRMFSRILDTVRRRIPCRKQRRLEGSQVMRDLKRRKTKKVFSILLDACHCKQIGEDYVWLNPPK